jgi:hypothetical protein
MSESQNKPKDAQPQSPPLAESKKSKWSLKKKIGVGCLGALVRLGIIGNVADAANLKGTWVTSSGKVFVIEDERIGFTYDDAVIVTGKYVNTSPDVQKTATGKTINFGTFDMKTSTGNRVGMGNMKYSKSGNDEEINFGILSAITGVQEEFCLHRQGKTAP